MKAGLVSIISWTVIFGAGNALGQNRPPILILPIQEMRLVEDSNLNELQVDRLHNRFYDPDGDALTYSLIDPPEPLNFRIDINTGALFRRLQHNFFTLEPLPVIVKTEDAEFAAYDTFMVFVEARPDPLEPFHLIAPDDSACAAGEDSITFVWTQAGNVDLDRVDYILYIVGSALDTISIASFIDTTTSVPLATLRRLGGYVFWWVSGYADPDTTRSIETFTLFPPLGIEDDLPVPQDFSQSAFPNPFNSSVTIRFTGGFQSAATRLAIYDISGRLVADLLGGRGVLQYAPTADTHKVIWDASSLGAGVYFVRLEAGDEVKTQKIVLMR